MSVKDLLKEWKPKKMNKDERIRVISDNLSDLTSFYIKRGFKEQDIVSVIFEKMMDLKFAKTLKKVIKDNKDNDQDLAVVVLIYNFLERNHGKVENDVNEIYCSIIDDLLKKKVKKIKKKVDLDESTIKELLAILPSRDMVENERVVGIYVQRLIRKMYAMSKDVELKLDNKILKKLFMLLFNEEFLNIVVMEISLERKDIIRHLDDKQMVTWNILTNFILSYLEECKKKEIKERLTYFIDRRERDDKRGKDSARRIQFTQISSETYPKVSDVISNMKNKKFL